MNMKIFTLLSSTFCLSVSDSERPITADFFLNSTFSDPRFLKTASPRKIHIGVSVRIIQNNNDKNKTDFSPGFQRDVRTLVQSVLALSTGAALHWVVLTDTNSVVAANRLFRNILTEHLTRNILLTYLGKGKVRRVPSVTVDYIDLDSILTSQGQLEFVGSLKAWAAPWIMQGTRKYLDDLFYVAPLYHQIFPQLDKIIFLDIDMEFYTDIRSLHRQFSQFTSEQLMGVGLDLSPHYWENLAKYRLDNPHTHLGRPGRYQGLNTGVVLYHLGRMRASQQWASYLHKEDVFRLMDEYAFHVTLGDQDWFTNISFKNNELFYILPCQFNAQVSVQYWRPPWEEVFWDYHTCEQPFHVVHRNGCGPERWACDVALLKGNMTL